MLLFLLEIKGNISIRKLTISILIKNRLSTSNKDEPLIKFFKSNTIFLTSNGIDIFPYHLLTGPLAFLYPLLEIWLRNARSQYRPFVNCSKHSETALYTESTPSTCCRARYLSLRSFYKRNMEGRTSDIMQRETIDGQPDKNRIHKIFIGSPIHL